MKFSELNLNTELLEAISYMGFETATPVQEKAIPAILNQKDLIACAQTGTGKTGAFLIPILNQLAEEPSDKLFALIVVPTRELAIQIDQQIQGLAYFTGVSSIAIYGGGDGDDFDQQKKALKEGVNIVVATPGKLKTHLNLGYTNTKHLKTLVLDEADRMLDMGFIEDIHQIINYLPAKRQNLFFSATMASKIQDFANDILHEPEIIKLALAKPAEGVLQAAYLAFNEQKTPLIHSLLENKPEFSSIVIFSSTKKNVHNIVRSLNRYKYNVQAISSDLEQNVREEVMLQFRAKKVRILVATDVISRGIDVQGIDLVINYDVPSEAADYVHRVGRTARAKTTGVALSLISPDDCYKFKQIEELIETEIYKIPLPKELGEAPIWSDKPVKKGKRPFKKNYKPKKNKPSATK